jgi:uncharacterized protein YbjQ (UPF0145 family)
MLITTSDYIAEKTIKETLGIARGSTVRTKNFGTDFVASLKNLVGGEVVAYTKMLADSREQAVQRMIEDAEKMGANAIISVRFSTSSVMTGAAEILAYGTAVKV